MCFGDGPDPIYRQPGIGGRSFSKRRETNWQLAHVSTNPSEPKQPRKVNAIQETALVRDGWSACRVRGSEHEAWGVVRRGVEMK